MPDPLHILSQPIDGVSFGLRFSHCDDRFEHEIFASSDSSPDDRVLISSVEGDATHDWPASPPLQDVHQQQIGDCPVIMAVGMAGSSHWSLACSLKQSSSEVRFHFDLACRANNKPDWLGSSYLNPTEIDFNGTPETDVFGLATTLRPLDVDGHRSELKTNENQLQILVPIDAIWTSISSLPKSLSRTVRWQFELEIRKLATER